MVKKGKICPFKSSCLSVLMYGAETEHGTRQILADTAAKYCYKDIERRAKRTA
jgi:hypothetical protein